MVEKISVRFFLKNVGEYASRYWCHVPRQGDEVMLRVGRDFDFPKDKAGKAAFKVVRCVYGTEGPNDRCECVNIEIEPVSE